MGDAEDFACLLVVLGLAGGGVQAGIEVPHGGNVVWWQTAVGGKGGDLTDGAGGGVAVADSDAPEPGEGGAAEVLVGACHAGEADDAIREAGGIVDEVVDVQLGEVVAELLVEFAHDGADDAVVVGGVAAAGAGKGG